MYKTINKSYSCKKITNFESISKKKHEIRINLLNNFKIGWKYNVNGSKHKSSMSQGHYFRPHSTRLVQQYQSLQYQYQSFWGHLKAKVKKLDKWIPHEQTCDWAWLLGVQVELFEPRPSPNFDSIFFLSESNNIV